MTPAAALAEGRAGHSGGGNQEPRRISADRFRAVAPPVLAVVAALVLSVPHLDRRPVWLDEAYTVGATHDLLVTWRGSGGTQALYYLLMWPVTQVSTDQVWLRLPSTLCAVAAVVVVHEIGRRIGGRTTGALSAAALACTWSLARYAIEARSYALTILLVSVGWLAVVATVRAGSPEEERRWWRVFVVASLLVPLAHGLAALQFAGQLAALGLAPDGRRRLRACLPLVGALAAEAAFLFTLGAGDVADWVAPLNRDQIRSVGHVLFGYGLAGWVAGAGALAAATVAVVTAVRHRSPDGASADDEPGGRDADEPGSGGAGRLEAWGHLVPVLWLVAMPACVLLLSTVRPYSQPRYLLGSLPAVALLLGDGLARIRPPVALVAASALVLGLLATDHAHVTHGGIEDWPGVVAHVADRADDGDRLLVPGKYRPPIDYWWDRGDRHPRLEPLSPVDDVGGVKRFYDTISPRDMRDRLLVATDRTVWYVDRSGPGLDRIDRLRADPRVREHYIPSHVSVYPGRIYVVRFTPR